MYVGCERNVWSVSFVGGVLGTRVGAVAHELHQNDADTEAVNESAIYGGVSASNYNYPWEVQYCPGNFDANCLTQLTTPRCEGVLINRYWMLTSFSCTGISFGGTVAYGRMRPGGAGYYKSAKGGDVRGVEGDLVLVQLSAPLDDPYQLLKPAELPLQRLAAGQATLIASGRQAINNSSRVATPSITATSVTGYPDRFKARSSTSSMCASDRAPVSSCKAEGSTTS